MAEALPEVEEVLTWGTDVTFRVRKKIFAIGGEGSEGASIKATLERQADLLALDSETFASSAYVGRSAGSRSAWIASTTPCCGV